MKPRIAARDGATRLFAHRGAAATAQPNTIDAFVLARELGVDGVASEVWLTADGQAMLDRDGYQGGRLRRRRFGSLDRADLADHIPSVDDLYDLVETSMDVWIDVQDPDAVATVVEAARRAGGDAEQRLWLCHPDLDTVAAWRRETDAKLAVRTTIRAAGGQPERLANRLREHGVDALSLAHGEWHAGLIALLHRFDRYALATGLVHEREMAKLLDIGIDGIASGHVDRMVAVAAQFS